MKPLRITYVGTAIGTGETQESHHHLEGGQVLFQLGCRSKSVTKCRQERYRVSAWYLENRMLDCGNEMLRSESGRIGDLASDKQASPDHHMAVDSALGVICSPMDPIRVWKCPSCAPSSSIGSFWRIETKGGSPSPRSGVQRSNCSRGRKGKGRVDTRCDLGLSDTKALVVWMEHIDDRVQASGDNKRLGVSPTNRPSSMLVSGVPADAGGW